MQLVQHLNLNQEAIVHLLQSAKRVNADSFKYIWELNLTLDLNHLLELAKDLNPDIINYI